MTKQEYQSSTAIIIADNKLGHTNRMIELRYIDAEYIASLEAEIAQVKKDKLEFNAQCFHKDETISVLQSRIAELEKENKFLKDFVDIRHDFDFMLEQYGHSTEPMTQGAQAIKDWMQENVIKPKQRIDELEKVAIVWHKYPDEKPLIDGRYLFWDSDGNAPHVLPHNDIVVRDNPGVFSTQTHWAYLPAPPEEEEC